uniref:Protein ABHD18 n=1 Tax=Timema genevievae TaxID=629358 RepID=A0A7R9PIS2_TIMGE|nr:unnamed protein product [Timema genevievae]
MSGSRLDHVYRSILQTKFFNKGWGKPDNLKRLFEFRKVMANRESCYQLVHKDYPVTITKENLGSDYNMLEGHLLSPFVTHLPGILPKEAEVAHFQVILPKKWNSDHYKPICLHLAGTGDHGFWRRRQLMAKPLIKEAGIAAIILENPFYGLRKPKDQVRSNLHNVSDIFVMGGCLMLESLVLFHWCERNGYGPLGITGMSMGGHMASLAATNWPKPLVLVPCLSWSTASPVFTQGVMSSSIDWQLLQSQYFADEVFKEEINKMVGSGEYAFRAGQHFAKHYPQSMNRMQELKVENLNIAPSDREILYSKTHCTKMESKETHQNDDGKSRNSSESILSSNKNEQVISNNNLQSTSSVLDKKDATSNDTILENLNIKSSQLDISENASHLPFAEKEPISTGKTKMLGILERKEPLNIVTHFTESKTNILGFKRKRTAKQELLEQNDISKLDCSKEVLTKWRENEALNFMRGIMDECTHLRNFDIPVDTSLIIAVCARKDAYVPREGCMSLTDIWPGAEVRYVNAGHVSAYLLYQHTFRAVESTNQAFDFDLYIFLLSD